MLHHIPDDLQPLPEHVTRISRAYFAANSIVPIGCSGTKLVAVVPSSRNGKRPEDALAMSAGMPVRVVPVRDDEFDVYLAGFSESGSRNAVDNIVEDLTSESMAELTDELPADHDLLDTDANEAPIIKLVNLIFSTGVKDRASDIHIQPLEHEIRVRFRIDGILHDMFTPPKRAQSAIISRIKVMAGLDVAEKRVPQDGRIKIRLGSNDIDVRVSIIPSTFGEQAVFRLLDRGASMVNIHTAGMLKETEDLFLSFITRPQGVFLVTGPTGSGKTTTLHGALQYINTPDKHILTVEDPIEYVIPGIGQMQTNAKIDVTFARALRSFLRQDPDVIMVGEVRDEETARIAVQAALTGHLVFSTLHTNDSASALTRLVDMGIEPYLLTSSITAILAQRLVRRICPHCKGAYEATEFEKALLERQGYSPDIETFKGAGCDHCVATGYQGRAGIFELLPVSSGVREMVQLKRSSEEIKELARSEGMLTLREDGMKKVLAGTTSLQEIARVTIE